MNKEKTWPDGAPNVLFITCHDLGKHLHGYGHETVQSPALDRLAEEGVLFEQCFCTAPQCSPSRAALHTGRYPHSTGIMGLSHKPFDWSYRSGERHVAERLKQAGYATALCGVQHVARDPYVIGFDSATPQRPAADVASDAVGMIRTFASEPERPFYLEVGFFEPHRPYDFGGAAPDSERGIAVPAYLPDCGQSRNDVAALQGAIRAMDCGVGEILSALNECGLAEHTWVIFTTDHGLAMPRAKSTLYDPGLETALIMRWPKGGVRGGIRLEGLISNVDIVPTMLDGIGLAPDESIQGQSFWPMLARRAESGRKAIFAEKNYHSAYEPMRAIRTASYKLIVNLEVGFTIDIPSDIRRSPIYPVMIQDVVKARPIVELYDLHTDPWERCNLAGQGQMRDVEQRLRQQLLQWMTATDDPILQAPVPSPYYVQARQYLLSDPIG